MSNNQTATRRVVEFHKTGDHKATASLFWTDDRRPGRPYITSARNAAIARHQKEVELGHVQLTSEERWAAVKGQASELGLWYVRVKGRSSVGSERLTSNQEVAGSIPVVPIIFSKHFGAKENHLGVVPGQLQGL